MTVAGGMGEGAGETAEVAENGKARISGERAIVERAAAGNETAVIDVGGNGDARVTIHHDPAGASQ